jgi:predicted glycogen debranching enzyme
MEVVPPAERWPGEWLEADGLGGFASGTVAGARTRRYHALLLAATRPPSGRMVLVNGLEVWLETTAGHFALSTQRYTPDVTYPDGVRRIVAFRADPWPCWTFRAEDGTELTQEVVAHHGHPEVLLRWRLAAHVGARLTVRPLVSGRDYHALHHDNPAFDFTPDIRGEEITWRPYQGVPAISLLSNGRYEHQPIWYRDFRYDAEHERGLDFVEDLASPGTLSWELAERDAVLVLRASHETSPDRIAEACARAILAAETKRRAALGAPLQRAADAYVVRRTGGKTIIAGYPWFTDWGRDTFIALRGLMTLSGGLDLARHILLAWAPTVSQGMVPNRFPDAGEQPEYNAVDASLWYVVAAHEYLGAAKGLPDAEVELLHRAIDEIVAGYRAGTRFGIRMDADGLIAAGVPGVQLTWMDAKVGDWVVTPRIGKPVEIQALWLNALRIATTRSPELSDLADRALASFRARFWNDGSLFDVVDVDHVCGRNDPSLRPNQIFAAGGLPLALLEPDQACRVVETVEKQLLTPMGLRSLAPGEPAYQGRYEDGVRERDGAYHQGTVWPWLIGPFVEAWLRQRGFAPEARREADQRFLVPLRAHLGVAGIGHISEIADGDAPHTPRGCPFQAWSLGELLRLSRLVEDPMS